ncbi:bifunctional DNA primase/polymerase [Leptothoe spongobia]|uniref:Uncharacterized protein n=1 Tax=Leptothoe spongobia TAU-MAC 1115 TaxID=1967444 RepID=A0A947GM02_9CYAN|nr:hypothetical protein [Leptothoe spongobia]MBT9317683.1 hypothetical protein [Leptothoe spongobia TAU-MAC 1115]
MFDPQPTNPTARRLTCLFDYKWQTIERPESGGDWKTNKYPMRPRSLWTRWQDAATIIGVRFGTQTRYAMVDIDIGSDYHNADGLRTIQDALEMIGLVRSVLVRSSWSGGWHLYFPLPELVSSFSLACSLKHTLEAQGIAVKAGQCELFPNIKPYGKPWEVTEYNGHRLPLQPGSGSCLLDHNQNPTAGDLERFFWQWDFASKAQDMELLGPALEQGRELQRKRKRERPGKVGQWLADLRVELETGWTGAGQTNALLRAIATHGRVFEGLADDELAIYIEQMAYSRPGYHEHCNHQPQIPKKSKAWARWATRFYWPMGTPPKREVSTVSINDERRHDARQRIQWAVSQLAKAGQLKDTVSHRLAQLCQLAKTSAQTLYKNLDLWHPDQWCVIPQPEPVSPTKEACKETTSDPPKPLPDGPLHTLPPLLRCRPVTPLPKNLHPRGGEGVLGGERGFPQAEGRY